MKRRCSERVCVKIRLRGETGWVLVIGKVYEPSLLLCAVCRQTHADALRALRRAGGNFATGVAAAAPACLFSYLWRQNRRVSPGGANRQIIRRQQASPHRPTSAASHAESIDRAPRHESANSLTCDDHLPPATHTHTHTHDQPLTPLPVARPSSVMLRFNPPVRKSCACACVCARAFIVWQPESEACPVWGSESVSLGYFAQWNGVVQLLQAAGWALRCLIKHLISFRPAATGLATDADPDPFRGWADPLFKSGLIPILECRFSLMYITELTCLT